MRKYITRIMTDENRRPDGLLVAALLRMLSWIYALGLFWARGSFALGLRKSHQLSRPVISVGNLTTGGVGKTPLIEYLISFLHGKGITPAVLLRGYMAGPASQSDESRLLREKFPGVAVVADKNRVRGADTAQARGKVDVFLLDDGFQHWRVKRDLDIVAVDATRPFGNGALIPRGILREPKDALKRAHLCVLTKTAAVSFEKKQALIRQIKEIKDLPVLEAVHQPDSLKDLSTGAETDLKEVKGRPVVGFCGIGDPRSFERSLGRIGVRLHALNAFTDHHVYSVPDVRRLITRARDAGVNTLITTAKDGVKVGAFCDLLEGAGVRCLVLNIKFAFVNGEGTLHNGILSVLSR